MRYRSDSWWVAVVSSVVVALLVGACSSSGSGGSVAAFCRQERALRTDLMAAAAAHGSDHVAADRAGAAYLDAHSSQLEALRSAAPSAIRADVAVVVAAEQRSAANGHGEPTLTPVQQAAADRVSAYEDRHCT